MTAPLDGLRVIEFAGLGPAPFAAMLLADMGAEIVSIVRPGSALPDPSRFTMRGRTLVALDAKSDDGRHTALSLIDHADVLIEGFRPGVMERLGLGPEAALARNPALVYGRMTGWGQTGPLAANAGHDINYIALTGALDSIRGDDGAPTVPLNLVGDYGGGALYLVVGLLVALREADRSGQGQVVDAAIVDGALSMTTPVHAFRAGGRWPGAPGTNLLDGGAHFYRTYVCADGKYVAVGAAEPPFYRLFRERAGLTDPMFDQQMDRDRWPELMAKTAAVMRTRTRDEWAAIFEGTDGCVTPVLSLDEAPAHPHNAAREAFENHDGHCVPAPAPRFSRTPARTAAFPRAFTDAKAVLTTWAAQRAN